MVAPNALTDIKTPLSTVRIFTDGACTNNGQQNPKGGWGAVLLNDSGRRLKLADKLQGEPVTNNRAELTAVIEARYQH